MMSVGISGDQLQKPCVVIYAVGPAPKWMIKPIVWGLEEEGIPHSIVKIESGEAHVLAKEAADRSPLNVGIAVHGDHRTVCLHHRDLNVNHPLMTLEMTQLQAGELRLLGMNAARLVKGVPLVFENGAELQSGSPGEVEKDQQDDREQLIQLIADTIIQMLQSK